LRQKGTSNRPFLFFSGLHSEPGGQRDRFSDCFFNVQMSTKTCLKRAENVIRVQDKPAIIWLCIFLFIIKYQ